MWPYFVIFLPAAFFALAAPPDAPQRGAGHIVFVLCDPTCADDWLSLGGRRRLERGRSPYDPFGRCADFSDYIKVADPGYAFLMWLGTKSGFNIWFVHLLAGAIFVYGLSRFCLAQVHPWLSIAVAIPYLVIVVAMGYDRQAVAIGFVMLAMTALWNRLILRFVVSMAAATAMHITALSLMLVFIFGSRIDKRLAAIVAGPVFVVGYVYFLSKNRKRDRRLY